MKLNKEVAVTIFARDLNFKGDIVTLGDLRIEGKVDGSILCSGKVIIDNYAEVRGPVKARWIDLIGFCKGEIYASEGIILASKSVLEGNLLTKTIVINKDAVIDGNIKIEKSLPDLDIDQFGFKSKKNNYLSNILIPNLNVNEYFKKSIKKTDPNIKKVESDSDDPGIGGGWL
jgi:cytoskeletal protein CcmA (bactofilin family)